MIDEADPTAMLRAIEKLYKSIDYKPLVHDPRCMNVIKGVLHSNENTLMELRQSRFRALIPDRLIITDRRMIIVRPSFWGYYLGKNLITPTNISIVPYHNIISVIMTNGLFFSTLHMRIHGITEGVQASRQEGELEGMRKHDANKFTRFIEEVIEDLSLSDQKSKDHIRNPEQYASDKAESARVESERGYRTQYSSKTDFAKSVKTVTLDEAQKITAQYNTKFIWLGMASVDKVVAVLGVDNSKVIKVDILKLSELGETKIREFNNCVLVSTNDSISGDVSMLLKRDFKVDVYVLEGGLRGLVNRL